jgi:3-hydroxy-3-methylglutaryl CoA synthase
MGEANRVGIEKINIYGCSLCLDMEELAAARGVDPNEAVNTYMIKHRSLNPPWEDAVTMGANAARKMLSKEDLASIGMLIVGTEGGVDFGKPMSTNIHGALGLPSGVRNYETKHACYSGVAALDTAVNWIAAGLNRGKKALVIATDFSRAHLGLREEFVMGGVGAAVLVSGEPKVLEFEVDRKGTWTADMYDTFRPSARHEVGNNEVSLFTYMDALEGSFKEYSAVVKELTGENVTYESFFRYVIFHTPFAGITFQAHRTLSNLVERKKKHVLQESFEHRVVPTLRYSRRLGSTYGASNFVGICSLVRSVDDLKAGDRIGLFAYGSGAIGEFYSGRVCPEARSVVESMDVDGGLDRRRRVSVADYEHIERVRETYTESANVEPDYAMLGDWYDRFYRGQDYLVLRRVKDFYRTYEWS